MYNIFLFQPRKLPLAETVTGSASCCNRALMKQSQHFRQRSAYSTRPHVVNAKVRVAGSSWEVLVSWLSIFAISCLELRRRPCAVGGIFIRSNSSEAIELSNSSRVFCRRLQGNVQITRHLSAAQSKSASGSTRQQPFRHLLPRRRRGARPGRRAAAVV